MCWKNNFLVCFPYVAIFLSTSQIIVGFIILLLGYVTGPFVIQTTYFIIWFLVFLGYEVLHPHAHYLTYILSLIVILATTIMSETLCMHSISYFANRIESRMPRDPYSNLMFAEYYEGLKLATSINAAILYIVNGSVLTYICMKLLDIFNLNN